MKRNELITLVSLELELLDIRAACVGAALDLAKARLVEDPEGKLSEAITEALRQQSQTDQVRAKVLDTLEKNLPAEW